MKHSDVVEAIAVRCTHLRTKKMYVPALYPEPGRLEPTMADHYWCVCTAREFGPDGRLVRPERCGPERGCCPGH